MRIIYTLLTALALTATAAADGKITGVQVYPPDIHLSTKADLQRLIVVATRDDGVTLDVTAAAKIELADTKLCRLEKNTLYPAADGQTTLAVEYQGFQSTAKIEIKDAKADRPISFQLDVMPTFMRAGCNTGSCHGAARGKDGFMLSLFGYDPDGDYDRITRQAATRRVNLALPDQSLMVTKAIGAVPHTGGTRYTADSDLNKTVVRWLEAGAPKDAADVAKPVSMEILPRQAVLEGEGATQRFTARAK